jgi:hypothetical protein
MFITNYWLKSLVQKAMMLVHLPLDHAAFHPYRTLRARAHETTVDFIQREMPRAVAFDTGKELLAHALRRITLQGIVAEFGVNAGGTINFIARNLPHRPVDGFDSFQGLPENWEGANAARGAFSRQGRLPKVRANVRLHAGWFEDTVPRFVAAESGPVAFLHVDCDLYSSTETIFRHLGERIVPGTVLVFDEYFNYPNWEAHEHRAFREFAVRRGLSVEYLGYSFAQVCVLILQRSATAP